jgi:hypothetical protein
VINHAINKNNFMPLSQPKSTSHVNNQKGFTYIELGVIFVLLGIISSASTPYFLGKTINSRIETMKNIESEMRSANRIIYARSAMNEVQAVAACLNEKQCHGHLPVMINNQLVQTQYGYAYDVFALDVVLNLASMPHIKMAEQGFSLQHRDAIDGENCSVSYHPANHNVQPLQPPTYDLNVFDCD